MYESSPFQPGDFNPSKEKSAFLWILIVTVVTVSQRNVHVWPSVRKRTVQRLRLVCYMHLKSLSSQQHCQHLE